MRTIIVIIGIALVMTITSCASKVTIKPAPVMVVKVLPNQHKVVVVKGKKYYYWNGNHYKKTRKGYHLVYLKK